MSSVRFSELVKRYGQPEIKLLWTNPKEDRAFMSAVEQGRVLTLFQDPGSKHRDVGEIGFHQKQHASYLFFPKRLDERAGVKVVGIKYDLITEPEVKGANLYKATREQARKKRSTKVKPRDNPEFQIRVRRTATLESTVFVKAKTKAVACTRALEIAGKERFDLLKAQMKSEVLT
jgi:hypothetical protein